MRYAGNYFFALFSLLLMVVFHTHLLKLIAFAFDSHLFFYILLVPLVSGYFLYVRRKKIFTAPTHSFAAGSLLLLTGGLVYLAEVKWGPLLGPADALIPKSAIVPILQGMRELRLADEVIYLRSASINIFNGMISLTFSCDGSHYMRYDEFLEKNMAFWLGSVA